MSTIQPLAPELDLEGTSGSRLGDSTHRNLSVREREAKGKCDGRDSALRERTQP